MDEMYKGIPFSPPVALADSIGPADTVIKVTDITAFPDGPNYATIGTDEEGETIFYAAKTFDSLSGCMRGIEGTAKSWPLGSTIARNFTNKDFETIQKNIQELTSLLDAIKDDIPKSADDLNALPIAGGTMEGPLHMNGHVLDGLNDPKQDDEAARKAYVDKSVRKSAPVNLLDNSDFTQFIAQAGLGGKHGSVVYAGDRWKLANGSISGELNSPGNGYTDIVITHSESSACYLVQRSPLYNQIAGKSCTVAIEYADGNRYCANFTVGNETSGKLLGQIMFFSNDSDHFNFRITGNQSVSIKHIWILPGTFTLDTMPKYRSKGFGPELSECMRYYQRYDARARNLPGHGATICYPFSFAMPMRITPTITAISVPDGIAIGTDNNTPVGASIYCTKEYSGDGHIIAEMSADL